MHLVCWNQIRPRKVIFCIESNFNVWHFIWYYLKCFCFLVLILFLFFSTFCWVRVRKEKSFIKLIGHIGMTWLVQKMWLHYNYLCIRVRSKIHDHECIWRSHLTNNNHYWVKVMWANTGTYFLISLFFCFHVILSFYVFRLYITCIVYCGRTLSLFYLIYILVCSPPPIPFNPI